MTVSSRVLAAFLVLAASAAADEVVLKDGRRVRGRVVVRASEIEVHHKFGILTFRKDEVDRIVAEKDLAPVPPPPRPARTVYANPVLGYQFAVPKGDWSLVRTPPFPLTDVALFATRDDAALVVSVDRVAGAVEPTEDLPGAEAIRAAWRAELAADHQDLSEVGLVYEPFRDRPAYRLDLTATGRLTAVRYALVRRYFVKDGLRFHLDLRRPVEALESTTRGLDEAEESLRFYEPQERQGDLYAPTGQSFQIELDRSWWITETKENDRARYRLAGPGDAYVEILVDRFDEPSLSIPRATDLLAEFLPGTKRGAVSTVNDKGLVSFQATFEAPDRRGLAWAFVRDRRLYRVRADAPTAGSGLAHARGVYERLEVLRDYSVDVDAERSAIAEVANGKRFYFEGKFERAAVEFTQALEHYPRDSSAHNYLALIAARADRWDEAVRHLRAARTLFPTSIPINLNYGQVLSRAGHAALAQTPPDYTRARVHFEEAAGLVKRFPELAPKIATGYQAIGLAAMQERRFTAAATDLARALELDDQPHHRHNLALVHYNEAADAAAKGNFARAKAKLREALEVKPDFTEAKDVLRQLEGR